jgi:hypothetical protein
MRRAISWSVVVAALALPAACADEAGRFPVCRSDQECTQTDASRPICDNLRCVECAYDRHCQESGEGDTCNRQSNTCAKL